MKPYYVYALKDPRSTPALPFYIGKGNGGRAWDHTLRLDNTKKSQRISEIQQEGFEVITTILIDNLTENQAFKLEAELISSFGTEDTGGILTNSVVPTGIREIAPNNITVPSGSIEKAQLGLDLLKAAILELAKANPKGVKNAEVTRALGLQSDYLGGSKDYLTWSILGLLMREGKMVRVEARRHQATIK